MMEKGHTIRKAHGRSRSWRSGAALVFCLFLALAAVASGCGKAGMPQPASSARTFSWDKVEAETVGDCILFTGVFKGAHQNFDGIRLELAGLSGPDDCVGCPFVPQEITELSPGDAGFNPDTGAVAFTYCPNKAEVYRWRLAGMSRFSRLPHATMVDRLLIPGSRSTAADEVPAAAPPAAPDTASPPAAPDAASPDAASTDAASPGEAPADAHAAPPAP